MRWMRQLVTSRPQVLFGWWVSSVLKGEQYGGILSRRVPLLGIGALMLAVAVAIASWMMTSPDRRADRFFAYLGQGNRTSAWQLVDKAAQERCFAGDSSALTNQWQSANSAVRSVAYVNGGRDVALVAVILGMPAENQPALECWLRPFGGELRPGPPTYQVYFVRRGIRWLLAPHPG